MFRQSRFVFLSLTLLLVLFVSMARPMAAYADDTTPPPPATEEPAAPPTEEAPVEEPASESSAQTGSETSSSETSTEPSTEAEVVVAEILDVAPEGTDVVVLDETGEALPL